MKSVEPTTLPTTVEGLTKLVRGIVAEAMQSTAAFCRQMDEVPSTGDEFLDQAIDDLGPVAQNAIVSLFALHGQDDRVAAAERRLKARVAAFKDPATLRRLCIEADNSKAEEAVRYWLAFGSH